MSDQLNDQMNQTTTDSLEWLLSTSAIREQAKNIFEFTTSDQGHFRYHPEKLKPTVDLVLEVTRANYPSLKIPFHSRWGHFNVGGIQRVQSLNEKLQGMDSIEKARTKWDLAITSVLLDAGAGMTWTYREPAATTKDQEQTYSKSEGLAVASLHLFLSGVLSSDGKSLRADSQGLLRFSESDVRKAFQVSDKNPLVGIEGRVSLMKNLGEAVTNTAYFKTPRPGALVDLCIARHGKSIPATGLLRVVLDALGPIWPGRLQMENRNLGDVWKHSHLGLVPFHKLSQWMTYSLIEPLLEAGLEVTGVEHLTGLAEYRNGGLILDSGLVQLKRPGDLEKSWTPDTDLIIEWRGLTVYLLDQIGEMMRKELKMSVAEFPLAKALEGGTWWAGRRLARELRADAGPPLKIKSDGTVF